MYVPTGGSPPSAQAQELGRRLFEVVAEYQTEHPGMTTAEFRDAFKVGWALVRSGPGASDSTQRSLVAVMLGLAIVGAAAALFMTGGFPGFAASPVFIVLAVSGTVAVVVALARSTNPAGTGALSIALILGLLVLMLAGLFFLIARSGGGPVG